jgi:hypothetical protein
MSRPVLAGALAAVVGAVFLFAPRPPADPPHAAAAPPASDPKDAAPNLGFDYRAFVKEQLDHVGAGNGGKALELAESRALPWAFTDVARSAFKKQYALLFANGGKYEGAELVGYKRLGSRYVRVYAVGHFEKGAVVAMHLFVRTADGEWKLSGLGVADGMDQLDAATPLIPFPPVKD